MAPFTTPPLDAKLIQNGWDAVRTSRELLATTAPLVRRLLPRPERTEVEETSANPRPPSRSESR